MMAEFFHMGGFGDFIWASYGFAFLALGWLGYSSWKGAKTIEQQLTNFDANKNAD